MVVERLLLDVHIEQAAPMEVVVRLPEGPGGNDAIDTKFLAFSHGQGSQDGEKAHHHAGDSQRDKEQGGVSDPRGDRSDEQTSELPSLMPLSSAVSCLQTHKIQSHTHTSN